MKERKRVPFYETPCRCYDSCDCRVSWWSWAVVDSHGNRNESLASRANDANRLCMRQMSNSSFRHTYANLRGQGSHAHPQDSKSRHLFCFVNAKHCKFVQQKPTKFIPVTWIFTVIFMTKKLLPPRGSAPDRLPLQEAHLCFQPSASMFGRSGLTLPFPTPISGYAYVKASNYKQ